MGSVLEELDAEWRELGHSLEGRRRMRAWASMLPALGGYADLQELLDARAARPADAQDILLALARLSPIDDLAARVLLQALVPGLVRLAVNIGPDDPAVREELVSLAWERIRTYPTSRFGSVAANVLYDTRKRYRAHRKIEAPPVTVLGYPGRAPWGEEAPSAEEEALNRVVLVELAAAQRRGVVSGPSLGLILRTRVADRPLEEIAAADGVKAHALAMRRFRAEQRLRAFPLAG
jgi:hypothetical protein